MNELEQAQLTREIVELRRELSRVERENSYLRSVVNELSSRDRIILDRRWRK